MTASLSRKTSAGLLSLGMAATVGGALAFEHIGGYIPCALCLLQRDPYYYGIPVAVAALLSALFGGPVWLTRLLLAIAGIMMLVGAGMGALIAHVAWSQFGSGDPPAAAIIGASVAGAVVAMILQRYVIIIGTAFSGAWLVVVGAVAASGALGSPATRSAAGDVWILYPLTPAPGQRWVIGAWLLAGFVGTAVQLSFPGSGSRPSRK